MSEAVFDALERAMKRKRQTLVIGVAFLFLLTIVLELF